MTAGSGLPSCVPFAHFDPDTSSWRTSQQSLDVALLESAPTWPRAATWDLRCVYAHPTSELRTDATDGSALLPTPAVNDMGAGKTPSQWDEWTAEMRARHGNGNGHGKSLSIEAARLLPTPTARDWKDGDVRESTVPTNGLLGRTASRLLPTPTAQAAKHTTDDRGEGPLDDHNLWSVVGRIGASTHPPSDAGNAPSDGQHRLPLTEDD